MAAAQDRPFEFLIAYRLVVEGYHSVPGSINDQFPFVNFFLQRDLDGNLVTAADRDCLFERSKSPLSDSDVPLTNVQHCWGRKRGHPERFFIDGDGCARFVDANRGFRCEWFYQSQ